MPKARPIQHVVRAEGAENAFASHHDEMDRTDNSTGRVINNENVRDVSCSAILQELGGVSSASVNAHRDDPIQTWPFYISSTAQTQLSAKCRYKIL